MRSLLAPLIAAGLLGAGSAAASNLISFTDNAPLQGILGTLDDDIDLAAGWTQASATSNVVVSVLVDSNGFGDGKWWITTAIGPGATPADVVASGAFTAPDLGSVANFANGTRTVLATGLSFAAGTYYLVLDGPTGQTFGHTMTWAGDATANVTANLAAGFSLIAPLYTGNMPADPFGPASPFIPPPDLMPTFVFELEDASGGNGGGGGVPEPASWALMILGLGLTGAALRRGRSPALA